jgi:hypothetical protein
MLALFVLVFANEYAAKAVRLGVSDAKKMSWVASFLEATRAPVRPTLYLVDASSIILSLGFLCAGFGWLTIDMNRVWWSFWSSNGVLNGLSSTFFVLASVILFEGLGVYPTGRPWVLLAKVCKIAFVVLGLLSHDIPSIFLGGLLALVIVGAPLFAFQIAKGVNCTLASILALSLIPVLLLPTTIGWIWYAAARDCLIIEPQPIRDNLALFKELQSSSGW